MRPHVGRRWAVSLCMLLLATTAAVASAQSGGKEYAPTEGQPGKDVIWLPSRETVVDKMLGLARVTPQDYLIDLGSGDGRLVIAAAKRGARALGIEYNPDLVELSKRNAIAEGVAGATQFVKADIFESDFSQASVITMFLLPDLNLKLRPKLLQLKPGTRVVSNTFAMADWIPDETAGAGEECATYCTALLWIVPASVDGEWRLGASQLALSQTFQAISGAFGPEGKRVPIRDAKLVGDRIAFAVDDVTYTGRVQGNVMRGEFRSLRGAGSWSASRVGLR